jgi:two-component sensor histidine kinase
VGAGQDFRTVALRLSAVVWTFGYVLVELAASAQGRSAPGQMFLANLPLLALGVAQSMLLALLLARLSHRPGYVVWPAMAAAALAAGVVQTAADDLWLRTVALTVMPGWRAWALTWQPTQLFVMLILYAWTMCLSVAVVWAARAADQVRLNEARAAAFEAAAARAEAAALRLQLNPHFLFNTLNGIASLVVRNRQAEAEEMIGRLADFLRASLAASPTALVRLSQELDTAAAYLDIERARFGERLKVEINVAPDVPDLEVPGFLLQPLVENAVKHGAARARRPTTIRIAARREGDAVVLVVANRVDAAPARPTRREAPNEAPPPGAGTGIGLANTRQRLATQYGDAAWLAVRPLPGGYQAEVGLPWPGPERLRA